MNSIQCSSAGEINGIASAANKPVLNISIGHIECRQCQYENNLVKNFKDSLIFHLYRKNISIIAIDPTIYDFQKTVAGEDQKTPDRTSDLYPDYFKKLAGEIKPEILRPVETRSLYGNEIRNLKDKYAFDYYLQGALSRKNSGFLMDDPEEYSLYLHIYDNEGNRKGLLQLSRNQKKKSSEDAVQILAGKAAENFIRWSKKNFDRK